jgi:hypothetical protein
MDVCRAGWDGGPGQGCESRGMGILTKTSNGWADTVRGEVFWAICTEETGHGAMLECDFQRTVVLRRFGNVVVERRS